MENPIVRLIMTETGDIDMEVVKSVCPPHLEVEDYYRTLMAILSTTHLSSEFITKYFKDMPLESLLKHNDVPESIVKENFEYVVWNLVFPLLNDKDLDSSLLLAAYNLKRQNYSTETYELIFSEMLDNYMNTNSTDINPLDDSDSERIFIKKIAKAKLKEMIDLHFLRILTKDFIDKYNDGRFFSLFNLYRKNENFSEKDLEDNIDMLTLRGITDAAQRTKKIIDYTSMQPGRSDEQLDSMIKYLHVLDRLREKKKKNTIWGE